VGAFLGSSALKAGGWSALCAVSIAFAAAALALQLARGRPQNA
jgi:hypothetical protein